MAFEQTASGSIFRNSSSAPLSTRPTTTAPML